MGSERAILYAEVAGQRLLVPDNGCWTLLGAAGRPERVIRLTEPAYWRQPVSATFHGRDIFAPVAAALAKGVPPADLGPVLLDPVRIGFAESETLADGTLAGRVMHVDHFGNCVTNLASDKLQPLLTTRSFCLHVRGYEIRKLLRSYREAAGDPGTPFVIAGSAGFLEISICCSSAARELNIAVGEPVRLTWR